MLRLKEVQINGGEKAFLGKTLETREVEEGVTRIILDYHGSRIVATLTKENTVTLSGYTTFTLTPGKDAIKIGVAYPANIGPAHKTNPLEIDYFAWGKELAQEFGPQVSQLTLQHPDGKTVTIDIGNHEFTVTATHHKLALSTGPEPGLTLHFGYKG